MILPAQGILRAQWFLPFSGETSQASGRHNAINNTVVSQGPGLDMYLWRSFRSSRLLVLSQLQSSRGCVMYQAEYQ